MHWAVLFMIGLHYSQVFQQLQLTVNCHSPWPVENGLLLIIGMQGHLSVATIQVKCWEPLSPCKHIQCIIIPRQRKQFFSVTSFSFL
jgi:hypothetical protein